MEDESNDNKFSLKSSTKTLFSAIEYSGTLNIPNFFILPEYDGTGFDMKSPSFVYANATWRLKFIRDIHEANDDRSFDVYLLKMNSKIGEEATICTIDLLDADGEIYRSRNRAFLLEEEDNVDDDDDDDYDALFIGEFNNEKPSYDRRDTMTLIIHLISAESFKVVTDQLPLTTNAGKKTCNDLFITHIFDFLINNIM